MILADDSANYEASEAVAIGAGKEVIRRRAPWLLSRDMTPPGFFTVLKENPAMPNHYEAHCVDGAGTKLFYSAWSNDYRKQPVDAIAMNANDLAPLLWAEPSTIDLYFACQRWVEENKMNEVMEGVVDALEYCRISDAEVPLNIGKIETASLDEMISLGVPGKGLDIGVVMTGVIRKNKVPYLDPKPGHVILGVSSTGLHSNGHTGARHVIFMPSIDMEYRDEWRNQYHGTFELDSTPPDLEGMSIMEAMMIPTAIYLQEASMIGRVFDSREVYGINITGNGLHNFNRVGKGVSFEITNPMPLLPIHRFLRRISGWDVETAYRKQNMGLGIAYVFPDRKMAEDAEVLINEMGNNRAQIIGEVAKARESDKEIRTTLHLDSKTHDFVGYTA